mmetsp:Transcript_7881/g.16808  ORF Transcript_7881/g.16808 Transcript_7881/m.16808 type:complete len:615 (+) Transcript_7881:410-2254(+)
MNRLFMPLVEWSCVAGFPVTILCIGADLSWRVSSCDAFSSSVIIGTALLSLAAVVSFNDSSKRGSGLVMGSNLVPTLYSVVYQISQEAEAEVSSRERGGSYHVEFAAISGLAFAISHLVVCGRRTSNLSKGDKEASCRVSSYQDVRTELMSLCRKCYLCLVLVFYKSALVIDVKSIWLGMMHILFISSYASKNPKAWGAWQDAFTPGEWMAVSTILTSLLGEGALQWSSLKGNVSPDVPGHMIVALAGLMGCVSGFILCCMLKSVPAYQMTILAPVAIVASTTFASLEMGMDIMEFTPVDSALLGFQGMPRCLLWLYNFLTTEPEFALQPTRIQILGYWVAILIMGLSLATYLPSWIAMSETAKTERVIIARKYFHLIAILLFYPITKLDPDMMSLSYAISMCLLILAEAIRDWDTLTPTKSSHPLSNFFSGFLDEKDVSAANGGLAITHIALIFGCAVPLWIDQLFIVTKLDSNEQTKRWYLQLLGTSNAKNDEGIVNHGNDLLPLLGVLVLGVGDSTGALFGIKFGRHRWPSGSSRTIEGSIAMLVAMSIAVYLDSYLDSMTHSSTYKNLHYNVHRSSFPLAIVTLVEASTTQVDNICLPVALSALLLIMKR